MFKNTKWLYYKGIRLPTTDILLKAMSLKENQELNEEQINEHTTLFSAQVISYFQELVDEKKFDLPKEALDSLEKAVANYKKLSKIFFKKES